MFTLSQNGIEKGQYDTYNAALVALHQKQGQSWEWAIKYEGWKIVETANVPA